MATGRKTRIKHKRNVKRQRPGSQAAYKKRLAARRRKVHNARTDYGGRRG